MATTPLGGGTSKWPMIGVPTYQVGQIPAAPTPSPYFAPSPDLGRIQFLTQQAAAPAARKLRMGLLGALQAGRRAENPNVQALLGRQAVAGYGEGLESVMGGARREGMGLYAPEYAASTEEGRANWLAAREKERSDYLAALEQYKPKKSMGLTKAPTHTEGGYNNNNFGLGGSRSDSGGNILNYGGGGSTYSPPAKPMLSDYLTSAQLSGLKTQGEIDYQKLKFGIPTGSSGAYDESIMKMYGPQEMNTFIGPMPQWTGG